MICTIINSSEGSIPEVEIATALGFNVTDNFEVSPKRYSDKAELDIFKAIIKPVIDWGLVELKKINHNEPYYLLTELGYRALESGKKYKF